MVAIDTVVFDLGGVLIDWDPRHLYRKVFEDEEAVERFLAETDLVAWHIREHDRGRPMAETIPEMCEKYPHYAAEIALWKPRHRETIRGLIDGSVGIVDELRGAARLLVLSNWPAETYWPVRQELELLDWFDGLVISGLEGVAKPDPAVFHLLCDRHVVDPATSVFVDDNPANTATADSLGFHTVLFDSPDQLRAELGDLGLLP